MNSTAVTSSGTPEVRFSPVQAPLIELRGLKRSYRTPAGEAPALRGVNLQVQPGEFVAVLGKSGAGKSTLVNLLTGIDRPDAGEIIVDGTALHLMSEDRRARWRGLNMGVVFQFFQLLPSIDLVRNITIAMEFCGRYKPRQRRERAMLLLEQVGIAEHAHKTPLEISGGQQQRLAIARALANDPMILVADEPTGNLDSRTTGEILDLFSALRDQGKTLLVVTHDKSIAARASRPLHLVDGQFEGENGSAAWN